MSSMGSASYRVETPEEIEARRRRAARERYRQAVLRHTRLAAETAACRAAHGRRVTALRRVAELPERATADQLEAATAVLTAETEGARRVLKGEVKEAFLAELTALAHRPAPRVSRRPDAAPSGPDTAEIERRRAIEQAETTARRSEIARRAAELTTRLPAGVPAPVRERCLRNARQAVEAEGAAAAELALAALEENTARAVREQRLVDLAAEQAAALVARLEDVPGDRAAPLASRLTAVIDQGRPQVPPDLVAAVDAAVRETDTERRRRITAQALAQVLADLDYQVDEGFETVLADRGTAYAALPDEPGYGLKVLFDRGTSTLQHIVVRDVGADGGGSADLRAQKAFCAQHTTLTALLRARQVELGEGDLREPGTVPVPRVGAGLIPIREKAQGRQREREAGA
ncbi:hypothetical protein AB0D74_14100 [Streptomyces sp. NPDC048278]|uniref:hypothetical protein n=1 Tax=Streptomyces sp. NPDC048278 TaxID=3155809 RepID=UPI0034264AC9